MEFLSKEHKENYEELLRRGNIKGDIEREIVMYIIAGGSGLYTKADKLYNFKKNCFKFEWGKDEDGVEEIMWEASLSSSQERLMLLALSLFSGRNRVGVVELFRVLDNNNKRLALNAIAMRY